MTFWRSLKSEQQPVHSILIEDGILYYYRPGGALSRCDIDDLGAATLKVLNDEVYWHLIDNQGAFVLIPERCPDIGRLRRYLSTWRGFNYDGLLSFDPEREGETLLWPLQQQRAS